MVRAALGRELDGVETRPDPVFGVDVPVHVEGVPGGLREPRSTWQDRSAYDTKAGELAEMFSENFRQFASDVEPAVAAAGPLVTAS